MRLQYPGNIKLVAVPCTGKVDLIHMLRAFEKGADGVYVLGCLEGECRYENGNLRAKKRVRKAGEILDKIGIGGERVAMYNLSSSEAPQFVKFAKEMTERIRKCGPNPIKLAMKRQAA
jgi:coenzyme F420-reducing hydrogenase delta subunit